MNRQRHQDHARQRQNLRSWFAPGVACVIASVWFLAVPAQAQITGTFKVTETWTATLQYSGFANYTGTKTFSGTLTGTIAVKNGEYDVIDKTGVHWSAPGHDLKGRSIYGFAGSYHISGDYPFVPAYADKAYGLVFLGCFAVKVSLVDGEVPAFYRTRDYSADGALSLMHGSGYMYAQGLRVDVSSTITLTEVVGPPTIVEQPHAQTIFAGQDASFTVLAGGSPPLSYSWRKGSTVLSGQTNATLVITNVEPTDAGSYSAEVTNPGGKVSSASAALTVRTPPAPWVETWESSAYGNYYPSNSPETFVSADRGSWHIGDTISNSTDCGPARNHAEVLFEDGRKILKLISVASDLGCADNIWAGITTATSSSLPIPLLRTTMISGYESGWMANPEWNGFFECIIKPCGDAAFLKITDDHANQVVYIFQRAPNYVEHAITNDSSGAYLEVFLDLSGGVFQRNLFEDLVRVSGPNVGKNIVAVEFSISAAGWAVLDDLRIVSSAAPADLAKPAIAVTSPADKIRVTNPLIEASGTAQDNYQVSKVLCQLNGGDWNLARTTNGWADWTVDLFLAPGPNTFTVCAADIAGNWSATNSRTFNYVVSERLTVQVIGLGTVSPDLSDAILELGVVRNMTATPAPGFVFSNWTGGTVGAMSILTNTPKLRFVMESNLVLQASFVPNPFPPVKGSYSGLIVESEGMMLRSAGLFILTVTEKGAYSGSVRLGGKGYPISGQFDLLGNATGSVKLSKTNSLALTLAIHPGAPDDRISGTLSSGVWTAQLSGDRAVFDLRTNPAPWAGKYTLVIPGSGELTLEPAGDGWGTVTVTAAGKIQFAGSLADGTKVSQSATLGRDGQWPLCIPLSKGQGVVQSWVQHTAPAIGELGGDGIWIKPSVNSKYYPAGFAKPITIFGCAYTAPAKGQSPLPPGEAKALLENGNLAQPIEKVLALDTSGRVTNLSSKEFTLSFTGKTGACSGKAAVPLTGKTVAFSGVVLQKPNVVRGYFLGTNQSGTIWIGPKG